MRVRDLLFASLHFLRGWGLQLPEGIDFSVNHGAPLVTLEYAVIPSAARISLPTPDSLLATDHSPLVTPHL
jgi:hypothetical protein